MPLYTPNSVEFPQSIAIQASDSATPNSVVVGDNATELLPADSSRKGFTILNSSSQEIFVGVSEAVTATDNFFLKIAPNGFYESPLGGYAGEIHAVTAEYDGGATVRVLSIN
jgi:hypothetical protein